MNITDNNNIYAIKLDELDLNYFYLNFPTDTTSPLWNKKKNTNFGNYDYCQFKVEAAKISDSEGTTCLQVAKDPNDASNINLSTYNCLLCNVNIPIVYRSEHKNSPKHKIYIKIGQIALERSKNLLTSTDEGSNSKATSKTIFCEPCAIAVNVTDKEKHDLSKTHQKSLLHDRYLNDLFMIYEDSVYLDCVNFKYLEDYKDAVSISEEAMTVTEGALSVTEDALSVTEDDSSVTEDTMSVTEEAECSADSDNVSNLNDSEDDINELEINTALKQETLKVSINGTNIPKHKWHFIRQDDIHIETVDKCILEVSFDNYHGFHTKNGQTQCRVCRVRVYEDKQEHILSSEHVARIKTPLENMHCLRKIDATYNYCVICNENFTNAEPHKYMQTHVAAVKKAVGMYTPLVRTQQTKLQKPSVPNNEPKLSSSTATISIEPKLTPTTKAPPNVKPKLTLSKTTTPNNELKPTNQRVEQTYCQACKIYIDLHNFRSHASGLTHKANFEIFENKSKPSETQPQNAASTSKIANNAGNSNTLASANKVDKATTINATATATSTLGKTYCEPCRIYIDTHNLNGHSLGRNHKMNLNILENEKRNNNKVRVKSVAAASKGNNFLPSNNPNFNYCEPCQIYIHINDSQSHTLGKNHKMNLDVFKNQNSADTPKDSTSSAQPKTQISNRDKIIKETPSNDTTVQNEPLERKQIKLHYLMQYTENDIVKCKVCDVQVPTHEKNIQEHIQGRSHSNQYISLLKSNDIIKKERDFRERKDIYLFCEICDVIIPNFKELRHIERHNKGAKMYNYCEYCNVSVDIADKQFHEYGSVHISAVLFDQLKNDFAELTLIHSFQPTGNPGIVLCKACGVTVLTDYAEHHLTTSGHIKNKEELLEKHMIIEFDDKTYQCNYCQDKFSEYKEYLLNHISSDKHLHFMKV